MRGYFAHYITRKFRIDEQENSKSASYNNLQWFLSPFKTSYRLFKTKTAIKTLIEIFFYFLFFIIFYLFNMSVYFL